MKNQDWKFEEFLKNTFQTIEQKARIPQKVQKEEELKVITAPSAKVPTTAFWNRRKTWFVTAAAVTLLFAGSVTPQAQALVHTWFGGSHVDKGLRRAEQLNQIESPLSTTRSQGITVTLQAVASDSTRTVLQVELTGTTDSFTLIDAVLHDEKGNVYALKRTDSSGRLEFVPLAAGITKAELEIHSIGGVRGNWVLPFSVKPYATRETSPNVHAEMPDNYQLEVRYVKWDLTQTQVDLHFTSPYTPIQATMTEAGHVYHMTSSEKDAHNPQLYHFFFEPASGTQPMTIQLEFYQKPSMTVHIPNR